MLTYSGDPYEGSVSFDIEDRPSHILKIDALHLIQKHILDDIRASITTPVWLNVYASVTLPIYEQLTMGVVP